MPCSSELPIQPQLDFGNKLKRFLDFSLAAIALPFAVLLVILLAVIVCLESPGPALFRQTRVGQNESMFTLFKVRTMYMSTPDMPSHEARNSMVTRTGRFIRRFKLDELPQIWNVLLGDMSFVGPRPCLPSQQDLREERRNNSVFSVRPGITGLAQVIGVDMSSPQKLAEIDGDYVKCQSMLTDLRLIFATIFGKGFGDAVK